MQASCAHQSRAVPSSVRVHSHILDTSQRSRVPPIHTHPRTCRHTNALGSGVVVVSRKAEWHRFESRRGQVRRGRPRGLGRRHVVVNGRLQWRRLRRQPWPCRDVGGRLGRVHLERGWRRVRLTRLVAHEWCVMRCALGGRMRTFGLAFGGGIGACGSDGGFT